MPVTVRTKLLAAFAGIAAVLVIVAVLGLRVLGQSNHRVESLGNLQLRASTYQSIQTQAQQLRELLALRVGGDPNVNKYLGGSKATFLGGPRWLLVDKSIAAALSQLGPATNEARFGFVPPPDDEKILDRIRLQYHGFSSALNRITALDRAGTPGNQSKPFQTAAINADNELGFLTDRLASRSCADRREMPSRSRKRASVMRPAASRSPTRAARARS